MSAMVIRSWMRALEQRILRPLGRALPRGWRGRSRDQLERRVEELEHLVRELAGLVSLTLDEPSPGTTRAGGENRATGEPGSREAA
jgi:hypothetical protein